MSSTLAIASLCICIPLIIIFGLIALYISKHSTIDTSTEFFLTAKNSQSLWRLTWSFYAASVGAWVLFAPASFALDPEYGAGWLGLVSYSFFTGLAVMIIAFAGSFIRCKFPQALSIGHYSLLRFGRGVEIYVTCLVLLNLSIGLYFPLF